MNKTFSLHNFCITLIIQIPNNTKDKNLIGCRSKTKKISNKKDNLRITIKVNIGIRVKNWIGFQDYFSLRVIIAFAHATPYKRRMPSIN